jgi:uncharacterized protein (TIGR04222 family)
VFAIAGARAVAALGEWRAESVDRALAAHLPGPAPGGGRGPYREPDVALAGGPLVIGWFPGPTDDLAVALLRGGPQAVAEVLLAGALVERWLTPANGGRFRVAPEPLADASVGPLHGALVRAVAADGTASEHDLANAAYGLAKEEVPALREKLRETHLVRSHKAVVARRLIVAAGGAFLLAVGAIRWIRGVELGHPVGLLTFELVVLSVALVLMFWRTIEKSSVGAGYVEWLDAATTSFRWHVQRQPDPRATDLRLAVAIAGAAALPAIVSARFPHAALAAVVSQPATTASSGGAGCGGGCGGCGAGCGG